MQAFNSKQYLEIDIATNYGHDKVTWQERLDWFEQNRTVIESDDVDSLKKGFLRMAKEPALVLAGIYAYRDMLEKKPTGYMIGLDATASGLQLLSIMAGCTKGAALCNVIDSGTCLDAYTVVYNECVKQGLQNPAITRAQAKQALMTHLYGSKVVPKEVFGEGADLATFYAVLDDLLPRANALNHALLTLWNPTALEHAWTLPDGFDVRVKVMVDEVTPFKFLGHAMETRRKVNAPKETGLSIGANFVHSVDGMVVREMMRRCTYTDYTPEWAARYLGCSNPCKRTDRKKDLDLLRTLDLADDSGFFSARILELIDDQNVGHLTPAQNQKAKDLITSLPDIPFDLLTIHDCFRCHPNYGNDVRRQYINIMAELADANLVTFLASQLMNRPAPNPVHGSSMSALIRQSNYAIC